MPDGPLPELIRTAETYLLRLFYRHRLPPGTCYDLAADLYEAAGRPETAQAWREKRNTMLGGGL